MSTDSTLLNDAPYVLQKQFRDVFEEGVTLVRALLDEGGQESLSMAFENPSVSTEQVLHPEKYFLE